MKYSITNPKPVKHCFYPEEDDFNGVVKDKDGTIAYYKDNKLHRADGPAVIFSKNDEIQYWVNDEYIKISTNEELKNYIILKMFE